MPNNIHLQVADPCHENWNTMTASEQGRYCQSCQKTVTDFSMMTDKEILNHLSKRDADVCGRFTSDQLNRTRVGEHKKKFSWAYVWNFMIVTFLTANYVSAQQTTGRSTKVSASNKVIPTSRGANEGEFSFVIPNGIKKIEGVIMDSKTNLPIPFAIVSVKGTTNSVTADVNGKFILSVFFAKSDMILQISSTSFTTGFFSISSTSSGIVTFYLDSQSAALADALKTDLLEQKGIETTCTVSKLEKHLEVVVIAGYVIQKEKVPVSKKIERKMADWTTGLIRKKEMTVYPNPVVAGTAVNISISVKLTGGYLFEIFDEEGRVMHRQQVTIDKKTNTVSISTHPSWAKGIYWVRATGNDSRKVVHSKLIIQ